MPPRLRPQGDFTEMFQTGPLSQGQSQHDLDGTLLLRNMDQPDFAPSKAMPKVLTISSEGIPASAALRDQP